MFADDPEALFIIANTQKTLKDQRMKVVYGAEHQDNVVKMDRLRQLMDHLELRRLRRRGQVDEGPAKVVGFDKH